MTTNLRYKINGQSFRRSYEDGDESWKSVVDALTDAGIDVFVKYVGVRRNSAEPAPAADQSPEE